MENGEEEYGGPLFPVRCHRLITPPSGGPDSILVLVTLISVMVLIGFDWIHACTNFKIQVMSKVWGTFVLLAESVSIVMHERSKRRK
jgi:hypothetical protein